MEPGFAIRLGFIDLRDTRSDTEAYQKAVAEIEKLKANGIKIERFEIDVKHRYAIWMA
ncbi:hypothetical protein [Effusibacillus pohliae]|uniref:hypothetical protein n=1 Tax=Effusibacillus pohliae TaxID=232270 RepID=UPI000374B936|nr:hypothetical protein [Effusibacillus pohliae]